MSALLVLSGPQSVLGSAWMRPPGESGSGLGMRGPWGEYLGLSLPSAFLHFSLSVGLNVVSLRETSQNAQSWENDRSVTLCHS